MQVGVQINKYSTYESRSSAPLKEKQTFEAMHEEGLSHR